MNDKLNPGYFVPDVGDFQSADENNIGTKRAVKGNTTGQIFVTEALDGAAPQIARGVGRYFRAANCAVLTELPLADGRRCDVIAIDRQGGIVIIEIKSCLADYRSDRKWHDYRQWCDRFYFAVGTDFPRQIIPGECGLIVADRFGAEIMRESSEERVTAARRKALTLRFARHSAWRLQQIVDPDAGPI
jgi:hypothetical protein